MLSTLAILSLVLGSTTAQQSSSSPSVICVAGQCLQGSFNTTIGASLSAPDSPVAIHLLPGQYASDTNPQLLHSVLTAPGATISASLGFGSPSLSDLPLNLNLEPGLAVYASPLYSGRDGFTGLPTSPVGNSSTPLSASSLALSNNVWAAVRSSSSNTRIVLWDAVPDVSQLPIQGGSSLTLTDLQSAACSPPCSGAGVCSASGTCTCPPGFTGQSCESCAEGFFGPNCQACPSGCSECDEGISGSGRCLVPVVENAPESCNCLNGVCGSNGQCQCNPGWETATNGTACAKCQNGFFQTNSGDCQVCEVGCTSCADGTATCISCESGFTQNPNDRTKCIPLPNVASGGVTCPDGSFSNNGQCAVCSSACRTCNGPSSNDCILCATGSFLFNGNCVSANSDGICQGTNGMIADNNKNECDTCGAKCTSCRIPNFNAASTVNQLQCTGCLPGFVLSEGKCVDSCPAGTFVDPQDNLTCTPCSSSCSTCAGSANFCLTCSGGLLASNGQCVSTCPSSSVPSSSSSTCTQCHPDCATCSGPSFSQCSSCPPSRPVLSNGRCLPTCSKSQFFDASTNSCQSCDSSCSSCSASGRNSCLACSSSTQVLRGGQCVDASCVGGASVVSGLGVCLESFIPGFQPSNNTDTLPGLNDPTEAPSGRRLEWWQILLMVLGCVFIFVVVLWCFRRRAKKQRVKKTKAFADLKGIGKGGRGWKERLVRFGERFFGHANRMYPSSRSTAKKGDKKGEVAEVLPMAYRNAGKDLKENLDDDESLYIRRAASPPRATTPATLKKERKDDKKARFADEEEDITSKTSKSARRETVDDFIDAYNYGSTPRSNNRLSRSSYAPSALPDLDGPSRGRTSPPYRDYLHPNASQAPRRQLNLEEDSIYSSITGHARNSPEPRQPLRKEVSGASRLLRSTTMRSADSGISSLGSYYPPGSRSKSSTSKLKEGVLVNLGEDDSVDEFGLGGGGSRNATLPLQQVGMHTATVVPPTDAQVYASSVRPGLGDTEKKFTTPTLFPQSQAPLPPLPSQSQSSPPQLAPPLHLGLGTVTLVPNGQGAYWLSPVVQPQMTGASVSTMGTGMHIPMQMQLKPSQPQLRGAYLQSQPLDDTVVIQPMHTGGSAASFGMAGNSASKNPFRQGST